MDLFAIGWATLGVSIAVALLSLLVLWLIIYTAIRAALRRHHDDVEHDNLLRADRAARQAERGQHEDWRD